jgi:hypothetical protein
MRLLSAFLNKIFRFSSDSCFTFGVSGYRAKDNNIAKLDKKTIWSETRMVFFYFAYHYDLFVCF